MTDADAVLVKTAAAADALLLPIRCWASNAPANQFLRSKLAGIPFRVQARGDEAGRKASENLLVELAGKGLLTISRETRVRFPLIRLTPRGDARARAIAGLPGRKEGRRFLKAIVEKGRKYVDTISGRWCPEIDLNNGKGWGPDATPEDRRGLADVELHFLAAAAAGWARAHSTGEGHAGYAATAAGLAELERASRFSPGPLPKFERAAAELYRTEQDVRLTSLSSDPPTAPNELGSLPLIGDLLTMTQAEFDEIEQTNEQTLPRLSTSSPVVTEPAPGDGGPAE